MLKMGMLENFRDMVECNQLDYMDEKPKCDEIEFWLELIERVQNGKTILFVGKGLRMINGKKYNEYLERENIEEPVSKKMLMAENEELKKENDNFKAQLNRWLELLRTDGINSKLMVANDIQAILNDINKEVK